MPKMLVSLVLLVFVFTLPAYAQEFTPEDINRLAHMAQSNKSHFKNAVVGVAKFSGSGVVSSTVDPFGHDYLEVDLGSAGQVVCSVKTSGIKSGGRVAVTGSVGDAVTAAALAEINDVGKKVGSKAPPAKEKDLISLITGTCVVRRAD